MAVLKIVPFSFEIISFIPELSKYLSSILSHKVKVDNEILNIDKAYDPSRNQYYSTFILKQLLKLKNKENEKVLGITSLDLYIPILTFVFGEAQLKGTAAIVSSFRLRTEYYGLPADEILLRERLIKESVHELGHTFGLIHCPNFECVMHSSTYVEEIDLKNVNFCEACHDFVFSD
ncbi:archaemetzincin family Zn-dependent metalloprotease [candidate division KSB1 bacterium]